MSEERPEFDVIVIGAGAAGGLPVGAYLQKAGARVLLVDGNNAPGIHCQSYEYQGGARCVPCAGGFAGGMMPLWDDLELEEHGAELITNRRVFGCIFPDDTSLFVGPDALRTLWDIARFSLRDAWTFARIARRMMKTRVEFNERLIYSEPSAENLQRAFEILAYCCRLPVGTVRNMNAFELLDHLFEDHRLKQVLFQPGGSVCLFNPWSKGEGALGVMMLHFCAGGQLRGSNRTLVDALERVFFARGGTMWLNSPVERIIVEDGVAIGIRMKGNAVMFPGQVVTARKAVVSNVGVIGTRELVGVHEIEKADPTLAARMQNWDVKHRPSVCTVWNLTRPPRWKAAAKNAYCTRADWVYIGLNGIEDWGAWFQAQLDGDAEKAFQGWWETFIPALIDPSLAGADGSVTVRIESIHPHLMDEDGTVDVAAWEQRKWDIAERMTDKLEELAPGFRDSIIEIVQSSPIDIWRADPAAHWGCAPDANVPGDKLTQWYEDRLPYRMPIKQMYACKGTWPIAFTWCATGYIAACIVAEDLGIRDQAWWNSRPGDYLARNGKRLMKRADEAAAHAQVTWFNDRAQRP
ncbi:MAG: phytoene desaturase family protein [Mycobacterium sp.]